MRNYSFFQSLGPVLSSGLALSLALLSGAVFLWLLGKDPLEAYMLLIGRGLSGFGLTETLIKMVPLLIISAGLLIALKTGVWNIGIDGQFLVGASLVGITAPLLAQFLPPLPVLVISALAGFLGGMVWGGVPALLKVGYGLNEIITTIMMNYVAIYVTGWLVKGPFKDPSVVAQQMLPVPASFRLPTLPYTRIHIGLVVGLLTVIAIYWLFRQTTLGFAMTVLGQSRPAAHHAGLPVARLTMLALLLSAGLAGLAGANDVLGVKGLFQGEWNPAYGLTGFALVFLARLKAAWIIPLAYFFAFLLFGGEIMARTARIPIFFVQMLEGLIRLFLAVSLYIERRYLAGFQRAR